MVTERERLLRDRISNAGDATEEQGVHRPAPVVVHAAPGLVVPVPTFRGHRVAVVPGHSPQVAERASDGRIVAVVAEHPLDGEPGADGRDLEGAVSRRVGRTNPQRHRPQKAPSLAHHPVLDHLLGPPVWHLATEHRGEVPDVLEARASWRVIVGEARLPVLLEASDQGRAHGPPVCDVGFPAQCVGHLRKGVERVYLDAEARLRTVPVEFAIEVVVGFGQEAAVARLLVVLPGQFDGPDEVHPHARRIPRYAEVVGKCTGFVSQWDHELPRKDVAEGVFPLVHHPGAHRRIRPRIPQMEAHEVVHRRLGVGILLPALARVGEVEEIKRPEVVVGSDHGGVGATEVGNVVVEEVVHA